LIPTNDLCMNPLFRNVFVFVSLLVLVTNCKNDPYSPLEVFVPIDTIPIDTTVIDTTVIDTLPIDTIPTDTTDTSSVGCNPMNLSFANDVTPVLSSYGCIGCHSGGTVILSTYSGTKIVADSGNLAGAINHDVGFQAMPQGGAKMDSCDIKIIENWITEGALDN